MHHPIDDDCGIEGKTRTDGIAEEKRVESRAKNNLCATGPATWVTFFTFKKLMEATDKPTFELGDDRSGARNVWTTNPDGVTIGEGSLVKLAAFVLRAHRANASGGENVNCSKTPADRNDIHIHLAKTPSQAAANFCTAVVAEIIPHFRPDSLNGADLMATATEGFPVRMTGHLFFDGEHAIRCETKASKKASSTGGSHGTDGGS